MSASAIANKIQYQDAFANKKQQQHKYHEGGLSSHPAQAKSELHISKARLEDPFEIDNSKHLSNATYNGSTSGNSSSNSSSKPLDHDAVDDESIYGTPLGKSQAAAPTAATPTTAVDTPLPTSASKKDPDTSAKDTDDYDKVVQVIYDHIAKELPAVSQPGAEPVAGKEQDSCCCGHKALEESAAAAAAPEEADAVEKPAEQKADAVESKEKSEGQQEETDEGDDTVIVTVRASEPAVELAGNDGKAEHIEKVEKPADAQPDEKKDESATVEASAEGQK